MHVEGLAAVAGSSSTCPGTFIVIATNETAAPRLDANSTTVVMLDVRSNSSVWAYNLSTLAAAGFRTIEGALGFMFGWVWGV